MMAGAGFPNMHALRAAEQGAWKAHGRAGGAQLEFWHCNFSKGALNYGMGRFWRREILWGIASPR